MRKARFTEHQIIAVLKSVEAGRTVKDVCREAGISEASYYNWKAKYGGMEASDIKKMKDLEDENRRLKQMFADLSLECRALKTSSKKALKPAIKRELVSYLTTQFAMSLRQACRMLSLSRTVFLYQPDTRRDEPVIVALTERLNAIRDMDLRNFFRYCAGRAIPGTIKAFTGFTAC
jgi:putative transposase